MIRGHEYCPPSLCSGGLGGFVGSVLGGGGGGGGGSTNVATNNNVEVAVEVNPEIDIAIDPVPFTEAAERLGVEFATVAQQDNALAAAQMIGQAEQTALLRDVFEKGGDMAKLVMLAAVGAAVIYGWQKFKR